MDGVIDHAAGNGRAQVGLATRDEFEGADEVGRGGMLENIGRGAGFEHAEHGARLGAHAEGEDLHGRQLRLDSPRCVDAVQGWHRDVDDHGVGPEASCYRDGFEPICCLAHDIEADRLENGA
jgi:hypothetical protein